MHSLSQLQHPSSIGISTHFYTDHAKDISFQKATNQKRRGVVVEDGTISADTVETISTEGGSSVLSSSAIDLSEIAGARLHSQAVACTKKIAERSARESIYHEHKLHPILRKDREHLYYGPRDVESRGCLAVNRITAIKCSRRLYSCSKESQEEGRKRRDAISLASLKRNQIPVFGSGALPINKDTDTDMDTVETIATEVDSSVHYGPRDLESKGCSAVNRSTAIECSRRLYNCSKESQEEGRKRRDAISLASLKKNQIPVLDHGVLPINKAGDMYKKGMLHIRQREEYLYHCRVQIEKNTQKRQEFKLAEGAFALSQDTFFQEKVFQTRYGRMLNIDRERRDLEKKYKREDLLQ